MVATTDGTSYYWSGPTGFLSSATSTFVTPTSTGTYSFNATLNGCSDSATRTVTVYPIPPAPNITGDTLICNGYGDNLTASDSFAAVTYTWTPTDMLCPACSTDYVIPVSTITVYSVSAISHGCISPAGTFTVTLRPAIDTPVISGALAVCSGMSTTLSVSPLFPSVDSSAYYFWGPYTAPGLSCDICDTVVVTPPVTTTYIVEAFDGFCYGPTKTFTVIVHNLSIDSMLPITVCAGDTVHLTDSVTGATTYVWTGPGGYSAAVLSPTGFIPTSSGVYTLTASNAYCSSTATVSVTVNPIPTTPTISGLMSMCLGDSTVITATSVDTATTAISYHWGPSTGLSCVVCDPVTVFLSTTTPYTVHASALGCNSADTTFTVTVYSLPTISAIDSPTLCDGDSVVLFAVSSGATEFLWTDGDTTVALSNFTYTPPGFGQYVFVFTATNAHGCIAVDTTIATVNPRPDSTYVFGKEKICKNDTTGLLAVAGYADSSASVFVWEPTTGLSCELCDSVLSYPPITTVYTVYALELSCAGPATVFTVTVDTIPTIPAISSPTVCAGDTAVLTATVTATSYYYWSGPGISSTDTSVTFIPTVTAVYTLIVTNADSCTAVRTTTVTVNPVPPIPYINGPSAICPGDSISILAIDTGIADPTFIWSPSAGLSCTVCDPTIASPGVTTTYAVYATALVCNGPILYHTVTVYPAPPTISAISVPTVVCPGTTVTLTAAAPGGTSYVWTGPGGFSSDSLTVVFTATVAGTYTLTAYTGECFSTDTTSIGLYPVPSAPYPVNDGFYNGDSTTICTGNPFVLNVGSDYTGDTSALSYIWSPGTGMSCTVCSTPVITPTVMTVYSVYAIGAGSCPGATFTYTVNVIPYLPAPTLSGDTVFCGTGTTTLTATFTGTVVPSYSWSPAGTPCSTCSYDVVTPTVTTTYYVTVSDTPSYCSSSDYITVVIVQPLTPTITATGVCVGTTPMFTASPAGGTWVSSDPSVVSIDPASGYAAGLGYGTTIITYTYASVDSACIDVALDTVNVTTAFSAGVLVGEPICCIGGGESLYDSVSGGTWGISNDSLATIDSFGDVFGVAAGGVTVSYTVSDSVCSSILTYSIAITGPPFVPPIFGRDTMCVSSMDTLMDSISGGTWYSYNPGIADVDMYSGVVTAGAPGVAVIAYDVEGICGTTEVLDTVLVITSTPPITGIFAACSGDSTVLSDIEAGGTWSTTDTGIAQVDPVTGVVTGIASGTAIITYTDDGMCGSFTTTVPVAINVAPFITTNFLVACQSLSGSDDINHLGFMIPDSSGCIKVCDSSLVRYYGNGVAGSTFTWTVLGGTLFHNYGDSIDVVWSSPPGTVGNITLADTFSHCMGVTSICVKVISKPQANFIPSAYNICPGTTVSFVDLSVADSSSPIASWYWTFGDGTSSSVENPTHTFVPGPNGNDTVTLTIKNACGCASTYYVVLNISESAGPQITCTSVVCDSQIATYSVPDDGCSGTYSWGVVGGTIICCGDESTSPISVRWDNVDSSGFGYVGIVDACSGCADTSVIKVPVILSNAPITGPTNLCMGQEYEYTLPLWPGTLYHWGVMSDSTAIVDFRDDHKLVVNFSTPGTYTIHGWYENELALCGGNVYKKITVLPSMPIIGPTSACVSDTVAGYTTADSLDDLWTIINLTTGEVITDGGPSLGWNLDLFAPCVYEISVTGDFCASPIFLTVAATPAGIDSVKGADTVCLGRVYTYTAYNDVPGTIYNWSAIGGIVTPATGSATVNVIWSGGPGMQLLVSRMNTTAPYCTSDAVVFPVTQEMITPNVSGETLPCANTYHPYSTTYTRGEVYDWTIFPNTAGSVVTGDHTTGVNVLWNNTDTAVPAKVILTVHKCDIAVSDTFLVTVQAHAPVTITASTDTSCPGGGVTYTATGGGSSYIWYFGEGYPDVYTGSDYTSFPSPPNLSSAPMVFTVSVSVLPGTGVCPASGMASFTEVVKPGPSLIVEAIGGTHLCSGEIEIATGFTSYIPAVSYQWYDDDAPIPGATTSVYDTYTPGEFFVIETAADGCSFMSDATIIDTDCITGPGSPGLPDCSFSPMASVSVLCNTVTMTAHYAGGTPTWNRDGTALIGTLVSSSYVATDVVTHPGVYAYQYTEVYPTCRASVYFVDTIGVIPNFTSAVQCSSGGMDSVFFTDNSSILAGWQINSINWSTGPTFGTGTVFHTDLSLPGPYVAIESINYGDISGYPLSLQSGCAVTHMVTLPPPPSGNAAFTFSVSPICSGIPINFTPVNTGGIVAYHWDFGDLSASLLDTTQRTYTYVGAAFRTYTVTLTVTDTLGCTNDSAQTVTIWGNNLTGIIPLSSPLCSTDTPVLLAYSSLGTPPTLLPITSYLWSTGDTISNISVDTSGTYWITVTDGYKCQTTLPPIHVNITRMPPAQITGQLAYCVGDVINLTAKYEGSSFTYQWFLNTLSHGTGPSVSDPAITPGFYQYQLVQTLFDSTTGTFLCTDTATDTIQVYALPDLPLISGPNVVDCGLYHLQLTATDDMPGTFNWSDGTSGALDDIYSGGAYKVWFTDMTGCKISNTVYVPDAPNQYLQYFPTGCYDICKEQLPFFLYGPPDATFHPWRWLYDHHPTADTGSGLMSPYLVNVGGVYNWVLSTGLCAERSDDLDINIIPCGNCGNASITAKLACDPSDPAGFILYVSLYGITPGTTYVLGTNIGPIVPFSGTVPGSGPFSLTLSFTTLAIPPPTNITVEVEYTLPDGSHCFQKTKAGVPYPCDWVEERGSSVDTAGAGMPLGSMDVSTAMLIFPNPTAGDMTISYDFGSAAYAERSLSVYDNLGRKTQSLPVADIHGSWYLNTTDWTPGMYIVRMEGDGNALQTQRVIVVSH